jgi:hypothetical protein
MDDFVSASESLEIVTHKYGTVTNIPNYPCWMEYLNEGNVQGSISFTRHTDQHPLLKDMVTLIIEKFSIIFPKHVPLLRERVHFIRTKGDIVPHRDENGRKCCINIGVKNSDGALTKMGIDDSFDTFNERHDTHVVDSGVGYLVDVGRIHAVTALNNEYRYLITYGFAQTYDKMLSLLMNNSDK